MRLRFHQKVYSDIDTIMEFYEQTATPQLADEFYRELRGVFQKAVEQPERFAIRERDIRRANLLRFPYHFLFRIVGGSVRVLVVRHNRRHPSFGIERQ